MKMLPWNVFGSKSRPCRLQGAPRHSGLSFFGAFLAENDAPRGILGSSGDQNLLNIKLLGLDRCRVPRKMTSGRGFGKNIEFDEVGDVGEVGDVVGEVGGVGDVGNVGDVGGVVGDVDAVGSAVDEVGDVGEVGDVVGEVGDVSEVGDTSEVGDVYGNTEVGHASAAVALALFASWTSSIMIVASGLVAAGAGISASTRASSGRPGGVGCILSNSPWSLPTTSALLTARSNRPSECRVDGLGPGRQAIKETDESTTKRRGTGFDTPFAQRICNKTHRRREQVPSVCGGPRWYWARW